MVWMSDSMFLMMSVALSASVTQSEWKNHKLRHAFPQNWG